MGSAHPPKRATSTSPCDGGRLAYFAPGDTDPSTGPEQAEPFLVERPQAMELTVITLVERRGRWLVHAIGPMVPPADLGLTAYSW